MDNSYFIYPNNSDEINIDRFHLCTWEFDNNSSLIEFGIEISKESINGKTTIPLTLFIPWLTNKCEITDLYYQLRDTSNSKFIFNDAVINTESLDGGGNKLGIINTFSGRNKLCLLPTKFSLSEKKVLITIDLIHYNKIYTDKPNIYIRFCIKPTYYLPTRKKGISKSSIIYDIKINERRNIPDSLISELSIGKLCKIRHCFNLQIIPNNYDIVFLEDTHLKSVRNLEDKQFKKYIGGIVRIQKEELLVVFSKKGEDAKYCDSFSFFSIYSKEYIGYKQILFAIVLNIICGLLFFVASFRTTPKYDTGFFHLWNSLPFEIYTIMGIVILSMCYFLLSGNIKNIKR